MSSSLFKASLSSAIDVLPIRQSTDTSRASAILATTSTEGLISPASGHWDKDPFQRGRDIEDVLGQNLPETFKTIDKYDDATGEATSIKSIDLDAKTYQTPSKLRYRLNKYLDELDKFDGYALENNYIGNVPGGKPINSKSLEIAIPHSASGEQLNVINEIIANGANKGINVKIVII